MSAEGKGIWKASELQRSLAEPGLVTSAGKMSGLGTGQPVSLKLEDLDVICVVLGCETGDLLIPEPEKVRRPGRAAETGRAVVGGGTAAPEVVPKRRHDRSLPPRQPPTPSTASRATGERSAFRRGLGGPDAQ